MGRDTSLKRLLQRYADPAQRERIISIVQELDINTNDPMFPMLLGTAQVQTMLETAPQELKQTFEYGKKSALESLQQSLGQYEQAARTGVEASVAESVKNLIKMTQAAKAEVTWKSLVFGVVAAAGILFLGMALGMGTERIRLGRLTLDPDSPRTLTLEEANALAWATSSDGRYARDLLSWNQDLLQQCESQMERFVRQTGLTLQVGSQQAESGFCLLWTEPPDERSYIEASNDSEGE